MAYPHLWGKNASFVRGLRVQVPRGTRKVYIPRRNHYTGRVFTEEGDAPRLDELHDDLAPCVVKRGWRGFPIHRCDEHPAVVIEEANIDAT